MKLSQKAVDLRVLSGVKEPVGQSYHFSAVMGGRILVLARLSGECSHPNVCDPKMVRSLALNHLTMTVQAGVQGSQQLLSPGSQKPQNKSKDRDAAQGQGQSPERPRRTTHTAMPSKNNPESDVRGHRRGVSFPRSTGVRDSQLPLSTFPSHLNPRRTTEGLGGLSLLCLLTLTLVSPETPQAHSHW